MKKKFSARIEEARDQRVEKLRSKPGDMFGLFCFNSPRTGATLRVVAVAGMESEDPAEQWDHVSVSVINRCPTWDEMCFIKDLFFEIDECVVQYHPPKCDYINEHPYVLHLWKHPKIAFPMPPKECI